SPPNKFQYAPCEVWPRNRKPRGATMPPRGPDAIESRLSSFGIRTAGHGQRFRVFLVRRMLQLVVQIESRSDLRRWENSSAFGAAIGRDSLDRSHECFARNAKDRGKV